MTNDRFSTYIVILKRIQYLKQRWSTFWAVGWMSSAQAIRRQDPAGGPNLAQSGCDRTPSGLAEGGRGQTGSNLVPQWEGLWPKLNPTPWGEGGLTQAQSSPKRERPSPTGGRGCGMAPCSLGGGV